MELDRFLMIFRSIINEFFFLNNHFDTKLNSQVQDYDMVFSKWARDMSKKYSMMTLHMHWATSSNLIANNQVILDVLFRGIYLFEVNYAFGDRLHTNFNEIINDFREIVLSFNDLNSKYDFKKNNTTAEYDKFFYNWRKGFQKNFDDIIIDIMWTNNNAMIKDNSLFLNVMYKDLFLFQVKYATELAFRDISMEEE